MSERRSGRARKQVDYSKFVADNDDDFADSTPPPPKKQKTIEKTDKKKDNGRASKPASDRTQAKSRTQRLPLDDKLYERDLQAALELSRQESQSEQNANNQSLIGTDQSVLHSTPLSGADSTLNESELQDKSQTVMPSAIPISQRVPHSDDIEFLGTFTCSDAESSISKQRSTVTRVRNNKPCAFYNESDDQDSSDNTESSDSGSDFDDSDSDFNDSRTKRKSKVQVKVKGVSSSKKPAALSTKKSAAGLTTKSKVNQPSSASVAARTKATVHTPVTDANPVASQNPVVLSKPTVNVTFTHDVKTSVRKPAVSMTSPQCVKTSTSTTPSPSSSRTPRAWIPPGRNDCSNSSTSISLKSPSSGLRLGLSRHARVKPLHASLTVS